MATSNALVAPLEMAAAAPVRVSILRALRAFGVREWLLAAGATVAALLVLGLPSAIIPNPVFGRLIATSTQDVVFWLLSSLLLGLLVATYAPWLRFSRREQAPSGRITVAGATAYLAIGCPICNKILLVLLGTTGTLQLFAPLQPILGTIAVAGLATALWWRLRQLARPAAACSVTRGG